MKLKPAYLFMIGVSVIPVIAIYFGFDAFLKFVSRIGFENSMDTFFIIVPLLLTYYGSMMFNKIIIIAVSVVTQKTFILKLSTVIFTFFALMFILSYLESFKLEISDSDKGILFEIVGFFIYLNPINKYLINLLKEKNDLYVDHDLIVKTTSVTLVVLGLILQLSTFE